MSQRCKFFNVTQRGVFICQRFEGREGSPTRAGNLRGLETSEDLLEIFLFLALPGEEKKGQPGSPKGCTATSRRGRWMGALEDYFCGGKALPLLRSPLTQRGILQTGV